MVEIGPRLSLNPRTRPENEGRYLLADSDLLPSIHLYPSLPPPRFHHTLPSTRHPPPTTHHPSLPSSSPQPVAPTTERAINISAISKIPHHEIPATRFDMRRYDSVRFGSIRFDSPRYDSIGGMVRGFATACLSSICCRLV